MFNISVDHEWPYLRKLHLPYGSPQSLYVCVCVGGGGGS